MATLQERLDNKEVIILDGAMGTELERRGVPMHDQIWSGAAVVSHPEVVRETHEDYIRAGADVIITNTFASSRYMLAAAGLEERVQEMNTRAVTLAKQARDRSARNRQVWIAGSLAIMAPGADKRRRPSVEQIRIDLQEQAEILAKGGVDLLVLEMMRDIDYSIAAVDAAVSTGLPVWVGFSCRRDTNGRILLAPSINADIALEDALKPVMQRGGSLVSIMHTEVPDTGPALQKVVEHWKGPIGAYPNSGYFEMPHWYFVDIIPPEALVAEAQQWIALGVQVIGGCCGIGPEHIRLLKERLPSHI